MATYLSIGNQPSLFTNLVAYDRYGDLGIVFFSGFGYASAMDNEIKELNRSGKNICFQSSYYGVGPDLYDTKVSKLSNSDYSHLVAWKKDRTIVNQNTEEELLQGYLFMECEEGNSMTFSAETPDEDIPQQFQDVFFDKLYKLAPLPVLKSWIPYITREMMRSRLLRRMNVFTTDEHYHFEAFVFTITATQLKNLISTGLREENIHISETANHTSSTMRNLEGLDSYLESFRDTLARRIQQSFVPRFTPGKDSYAPIMKDITDYESYMGGLSLYEAQRGVIQAASTALDSKKACFIIGEQGSGKTAMAITTALVHNNDKKYMTNVVMCPPHLVEKWRYEIQRLAPLSKVVIVTDFDHLTSLMPVIKDRSRRYHLWLVLSKETAKFGYEERPAAVWSESAGRKLGHYHGVYCCPECGKPLYSISYVGQGSKRYAVYHYFDEEAFSKKVYERGSQNITCMNTIKTINQETGTTEEHVCGCHLWEAVGKWNKEEDIEMMENEPLEIRRQNTDWVKLGTQVGWIERKNIRNLTDKILNMDAPSRTETAKLPALQSALEGDIPVQRAPIKYPLGRYIRKYLKGYIDYFLADEVHELKGRNLQSDAFGDLVATAKHSLCFTGTLLNGYATSVFYMLYRCFPGMMKEEGFEFSSAGEAKFMREYGVYEESSWYYATKNGKGDRTGSTKKKQLPGISPLVFTKFLLENAAFISLDDIGTGLPGYEEIPVAVDMDKELTEKYRALEHKARKVLLNRNSGGLKVLGQLMQTLTIYPDQPFDQPPVIHPDTGEVLIEPPSLNSSTQRAKETEFLNIVQQRVRDGEKVLAYYTWVGRTNLGSRLTKLLRDNGIKAMELKSSVSARERERWIKKQIDDGLQVLICNPALVETGLDLLDFTTIIFYQMGYKLSTMRQASRRSWRLSQDKDVHVYFMYYRQTVQEQALSLMATKLQAAMAIEGKFSEEGLNAMSNNQDVLTQLAASVADGIKDTVDAQVFSKGKVRSSKEEKKEDTRRILKPIKKVAPTFRERLAMKNKLKNKSKKRIVRGTAVGLEEQEVLENPWMLFNAV